MSHFSRPARWLWVALSAPLVMAACDDDDDSPTGPGGSSAQLVFASDRDTDDQNLEIYSVKADGTSRLRLLWVLEW